MNVHAPFHSVVGALIILIVVALSGVLLAAEETAKEVPFGNQVSTAITKYNWLRPGIATSGPLKEGAISELKSLGFATIVDLRSADEGTDVEKKAVEAAGLRYLNIPVTIMVPSDEQVAEFARIVEDATYFPLLIHCGSANRVGAMWALYLVHHGMLVSIAVEEGQTIGLQGDREKAALNHLGMPKGNHR